MAIHVAEAVDVGAEETGGTRLSKLFRVPRGGMTAEETAKR